LSSGSVAGGDEQAVERQVEIEAAGGAVPDRDAEVLLERGTRPEPEVVVRTEEVRGAEVAQLVRELPRRRDDVVVVAPAVGPEPVAVVVVLEVAEELERFRWPHDPRTRQGDPRSPRTGRP
jgi:hypothetical protein